MDYWDYRPVILIITGFQGLLTCNYMGLQALSYTDYGITRGYIVGDNKDFKAGELMGIHGLHSQSYTELLTRNYRGYRGVTPVIPSVTPVIMHQ